ncbi:MAG TPA: hypothetical protein VNK45_10195, partial [Candidatus Acidoferrales bacterium]|nr:hypothetical protein [Candidatus Acidoferrales bacterium]
RPWRAKTLISTACSWVNMFGGQKAAILAQVGHFYFGRWVTFTSAGGSLLLRQVGQFYIGGDTAPSPTPTST